MHRLIDALTGLIENPEAFKGTRPESPRAITADLTSAPECVQRLARAMASRYYHVELGGFSMFENGAGDTVSDLAETIEFTADEASEDLASAYPAGFVPSQTLNLGADGGGASVFGIAWAGGVASVIIVELEDAHPDNFIQQFTTPAELLAYLDEIKEDDDPPDLKVLKSAVR